MENPIKKWLEQFKTEKAERENIYVPIIKTIQPTERLDYNKQAQHIRKEYEKTRR